MTKNEEIVAKRENFDEGGTQKEIYLLKSNYLLDFLHFTNQNIVFAFRSHRYSERYLSELGFKKTMQEFSSEKNNYFFQCKSIIPSEHQQRQRANSFSIVSGKCISLAL